MREVADTAAIKQKKKKKMTTKKETIRRQQTKTMIVEFLKLNRMVER